MDGISKLRIVGILGVILVLTLACNLPGKGVDINIGNVDIPDVPEGVGDAADSVIDEVVGLAGQGMDYTGTLEAFGVDITLQDMMGLFNAIQLDGDGTAEITLTEAQVNKAIQTGEAAGGSQGVDTSAFGEFSISFEGGYVVFTGKLVIPPGELKVKFQPTVANGVLSFSVVEASFNEQEAPSLVISMAETILNGTLSLALNNVPAGMGIQAVSVGEGTMTVVVAGGF